MSSLSIARRLMKPVIIGKPTDSFKYAPLSRGAVTRDIDLRDPNLDCQATLTGETTRNVRRAHGHPVSPGCLGLVERYVRCAQHSLSRIAVGGKAGKSYRDGQLEHSLPR